MILFFTFWYDIYIVIQNNKFKYLPLTIVETYTACEVHKSFLGEYPQRFT